MKEKVFFSKANYYVPERRAMGLLQKFKEFNSNRHLKKVEKAARTIKNAKAIKEDRWAALQFMASLEDPKEAVNPLLARFEYSLEHGINDTREKELAMEGILNHKEGAVSFIQEWLKKTNRIAWPIKVLKELRSEDVIVESLKGALNYDDVSFDQAAVDKNFDILCYLRDYKLLGFLENLKHFLKDPDERVRFACIEVLLEQDDEEIPSLLEPYIADGSAENIRLHQAVITGFIDKGWKLKDVSLFEGGVVEEGVVVNQNGLLQRV